MSSRLPVLFLADEAGQLFADLALTISVAVSISLLAVVVLPTAAMNWLKRTKLADPHEQWWDGITARIMQITGPRGRTFWIVGLLTLTLLLLVWFMAPKADYLPEGNRNLIFSFINPPPGANIGYMEKKMGTQVAAAMSPYLSGEKQPQVSHYFFMASIRWPLSKVASSHSVHW